MLLIAVAALGVAAYAGFALAASDTIVATPPQSFSQPTYDTDQGEIVPFRNDGGSHNVTARGNGPDGKALFRSATTSGGQVSVNGTQYLNSGDYPFLCTIHPTTMNGTLRVTGAGAPVPRPQATLSLKAKSITNAIKKGLLVSINASVKIDDLTLTAKLGQATLGKATVATTAGSQTLRVKLSKAGKSKLRNKAKATVKVTAEIPFGSPASTKKKLS